MADMARAVIGGIVITIVLLAGVSILNPIVAQAPMGGGSTSTVYQDAGVLQGAGTFVKLNSGDGTNQTVYETTGYAVNLTGADDSYVNSQSDFEIATDQNWTVSAWGYVDSAASSNNMTLVSANGRAIISYNGSANQWEGWYYDEGARNSYEVTVATSGNETGNLTNVMLVANGTHLAIYRNNTLGGVADITASSTVSAPVESGNWDGRIEEIRTFDEALNATRRGEVVNSPTEEQHDASPTSRAMFDQPNASTQLLLYTDTSLTVSNATYSAGFSEDVQSEGTDYEWDEDGQFNDNNGPRLKPLAGGDIANAPVAYADYDFEAGSVLASIVPTMTGAYSDFAALAIIVPLVLIVSAILVRVKGM